jgi:hypothetical protein
VSSGADHRSIEAVPKALATERSATTVLSARQDCQIGGRRYVRWPLRLSQDDLGRGSIGFQAHINKFVTEAEDLCGHRDRLSRELLEQIGSTKPELSDLPVMANVDFGHTTPIITFPIGGTARVVAEPDDPRLTITHH